MNTIGSEMMKIAGIRFYAPHFSTALILLNFFVENTATAGVISDSSFFPIAVWLQSPSNAASYKQAGINLYVGLWDGPTQEQLDELKMVGMPVLCDQNKFALDQITTYQNVIEGWMHGDEPDNAQSNETGGYDPCINPDIIIDEYITVKRNDPQRPVYLNLGQGVSNVNYIGRGSDCHGRTDMYPKYIKGCDIVSYDIYPVNSPYDEIRGNLWYVPKGIDSLRLWSDHSRKVWCWIECTRIDSSSVAAPTPSQVKAEVWMALVHGANGIGYFCHSWYGGFKEAAWLSNTQMKNAITAVNSRITALAPVLNSPSVTGRVTAISGKPSVPVDIMVKRSSGSLYIFAVAMRNNSVIASFSIDSMPGTANVEVFDENRTITATGGTFQDSFEGYGVHLYKIPVSSGIYASSFQRKIFARTSLRLITVMQGENSFPSFLSHSDGTLKVYSMRGTLLKKISKIDAGKNTLPSGAYFVSTK
jgi:hypothetical protein